MISIANLAKTYLDGDRLVEVLKALSLEVSTGASLAITGPSGSGKSTLLNIIAGLVQADAGTVEIGVDGLRVALQSSTEKERTAFRRQNIGYVHQFFNLVPTLTVWENVALPGVLNKKTGARDRAMDLLAEFGLEDRADAFPDILSGGEQQRVAVARAMIIEPAVVLADEPTGNLDQENTDAVTRLLFDSCDQFSTTLIVATHSEAVASLADDRLELGKPSLEILVG
ncbi:MAG: ATP-binding cassette domain-containing protein [Pseudomonadales bacterium]|nr:ATP-binding cassette domain-containing protein [Pseudomonadales bacterium]